MEVSRVSSRRCYILICIQAVCHARKVLHFAAKAQGFVKITRLRRSYTLGSAISEWRLRVVESR